MKTTLIKLGLFGIGLGIGYLGAYARYKQKVEALDDAFHRELESMEAYYQEREANEVKAAESKDVRSSDQPAVTHIVQNLNYRAFSEAPDNIKEDTYEDDEDPAESVSPSERSDEPRKVSREEYAGMPDGENVVLEYYEEDDTLCYEENDEVVEDTLSVVGDVSLDAFGDDDVIYVRDDMLKINYEVHLIHNSYRRAVLCVVD